LWGGAYESRRRVYGTVLKRIKRLRVTAGDEKSGGGGGPAGKKRTHKSPFEVRVHCTRIPHTHAFTKTRKGGNTVESSFLGEGGVGQSGCLGGRFHQKTNIPAGLFAAAGAE